MDQYHRAGLRWLHLYSGGHSLEVGSLSGRQAVLVLGLLESVTSHCDVNVTKIPLGGLYCGSVGSERLFSLLSPKVPVTPEIELQRNLCHFLRRSCSQKKQHFHLCFMINFYRNSLGFRCRFRLSLFNLNFYFRSRTVYQFHSYQS